MAVESSSCFEMAQENEYNRDSIESKMEGIYKIESYIAKNTELSDIAYNNYESELQMPDIMRLIQKDLSEPYSIYTYRYFIHNWPQLCYLVSLMSDLRYIKS